MAHANVISDQSSFMEDGTPTPEVLSGSQGFEEGFAMYNTLHEQQIQIYRIKNQSLSSISEENREDGDQTYTYTEMHTSQEIQKESLY